MNHAISICLQAEEFLSLTTTVTPSWRRRPLLMNHAISLCRQAEEFLSLANWSVLKNPDCSNHLRSQLHRNFGKLYSAQGKLDEALVEARSVARAAARAGAGAAGWWGWVVVFGRRPSSSSLGPLGRDE